MVHLLEEMEAYANENHIPIMLPDGIDFLTDYIKNNKVTKILEIGTAIGYSAIKMALVDPRIHVVSIERDPERYRIAVENVHKAHLEQRIELIHKDAFDVVLEDTYDLIFIDAAKAQYIKFFERYKQYLEKDGVIVSDNLNFHGYTHQKERIDSKNLRQLVQKLNKYITFLHENKEFHTEFYEVGDGIGISRRIS